MSHYIVQDAAACMPSSCKGRYRRVAVLEVEDGVERASMISDRARDVIRVVETWEKLNVGSTDRCAFRVARREAETLAGRLNAVAAAIAGLAVLASRGRQVCTEHEDCRACAALGAACLERPFSSSKIVGLLHTALARETEGGL